jgi:isocitrate/isopropylmalate dehydrogenase
MMAMRGVSGGRPPGPARSIRLAVIGGDGIGPEVVAEAVKVLRAAVTDAAIETTDYDLGSQRWLRTGEALPASGAGGVMRKGTAGEVATQESINTAFGVRRLARYALQRAAGRPRRKLTLVHQTNVLAYAGDLLDRQGAWADRSTLEIGDDIAERAAG